MKILFLGDIVAQSGVSAVCAFTPLLQAQYHPDFFRQWLFPHWDKIVDVIRSSPEYTPF